MKHVICILLLAFMASCAGNEMIEEVVTDSSSVRTRSAGTGVYSNDWCVRNATLEGNVMSYDLVYSNTESQRYVSYALYTLFLYKGSYDGYYGGYSISWHYDWTTRNYYPEDVPEEYGVVNMEWDECLRLRSGETILPNSTYSSRRTVKLAPGKTLEDIEYVLFFLYDNKHTSNQDNRYVDECYGFFLDY